ncbi:hypothetical protein HDV02_005755 [Globomyces sp. JEL0801]|nr:hypothetical protein HDV02_005755 [Globomyces sp. JEL0801]
MDDDIIQNDNIDAVFDFSPEEEQELMNMANKSVQDDSINNIPNTTTIDLNAHDSITTNPNSNRLVDHQLDGVFSNMAVKPSTEQGKVFEEIEPPSYHDVIVDPSPDYHINCVDENGDVLIEGLPVGDYFVFLVNTFISMTFDILGFFLTTLLSTNHAARLGSQSGLGLTLLRYGCLIKTKVDNDEFPPVEYENGYRPDPEEEKSRREWSAVFIIAMGVFVIIRSNVEFFRLVRMKALIGSTAYHIPA